MKKPTKEDIVERLVDQMVYQGGYRQPLALKDDIPLESLRRGSSDLYIDKNVAIKVLIEAVAQCIVNQTK